jgi:hypothetical protein
MTALEYLRDAPYKCGVDNINMVAFEEAMVIIGGHDTVKEFLAYDIWLLSDD